MEGAEAVLEHLSELPIGRYAALTGIDEATIRRVAEVIALPRVCARGEQRADERLGRVADERGSHGEHASAAECTT